MKPTRRLIVTIAVTSWLSAYVFAAVDPAAVLEDLQERSGIDLTAQQQALVSGRLLSSVDGRLEVVEAELVAAQFMYLPLGVDRIAQFLTGDRPFRYGVRAAQELIEPTDEVNIVAFHEKEMARLAKAKPGDAFNFSRSEYAKLSEQEGVDGIRVLNDILTQRHRAYRASGLDGVEGYQRSRKHSVDTGATLRTAVEDMELLERHFPEFRHALLEHPQSGEGVRHRFFAVEKKVEGRPQYVLVHWMIDARENYVLLAQRHFYVSHTYDTLQIVVGCLPYQSGTLVMMMNQTFTEKVAGMASGIAHKIGRKRVAETIANTFEALRIALEVDENRKEQG